MTMKKSELKSMIREILKEELLHEERGIINAKAFYNQLKAQVERIITSGSVLSKETGEVVATINKDFRSWSGYKYDIQNHCFYLVDAPKEAVKAGVVLDDDLKAGIRKIMDVYADKDNGFDRKTDVILKWESNGPSTMHLLLNVTLEPKPGFDYVTPLEDQVS